MTTTPTPEEALQKFKEALEKISMRPNFPNPDRNADWRNCQKWSSAEAKESSALIPIIEAAMMPELPNGLKSAEEWHKEWRYKKCLTDGPTFQQFIEAIQVNATSAILAAKEKVKP